MCILHNEARDHFLIVLDNIQIGSLVKRGYLVDVGLFYGHNTHQTLIWWTIFVEVFEIFSSCHFSP
jgi:hypothetical protein